MGDPKRQKKKYKSPKKPWDAVRIKEEKIIVRTYGLKNKREIRKADALLSKFRINAKELSPTKKEAEKKELVNRMTKFGVLESSAKIEDVLSLKVEDILDRRLESVVFKLGLTKTAREARQRIVHGKVRINGKKVTIPSYLVKREEEKAITIEAPQIKEKLPEIQAEAPAEEAEKKTEEVVANE